MIRKNLLIAYAQDFVSYLLTEKYMEKYKIKNIILYGSVARGAASEKSDIDIFIDVLKSDKSLEKNIKSTIKRFYKSSWFKKWERLQTKNEISCLVGNLEEWKDLKASIISDGIVLFGKFKPKVKGKLMVLFSLNPIKPDSRRIGINRKLFGFTKYKKKYGGLLKKYSGEKIAQSCFIVPIEFSKEIIKLLREKKVKFQIREISIL